MVVNDYPDENCGPLQELLEEISKSGQRKEYNNVRLFVDELKKHGLDVNKRFKREAYKRLDDNLYELRPGQYRIIFIVHLEEIYLITQFKKQTNKTPKNEIDKAKMIKNRIIKLKQ